jgi:glycosyltransferase involved in cell wall biosynthesis
MIKSENILLSIITINLNNANGLARTIDSLAITRNHIEIETILIDGGSSDGSYEYAKKYYENNKIISEADDGIYDAMNKSLKIASGKFIIWINSGDELSNNISIPDLINKLNTTYKNNDLTAFACMIKSSPSCKTHEIIYPSKNQLPNVNFPHQSIIYKREKIIKEGGYKTKYKICADRDLLIRLFISNALIVTDTLSLSIFYKDGISSRTDTYPENLLIDYNNKIIGIGRFYIKMIRYILGDAKKKLLHIIK